jgi:signal transduction histidine kinase
VNKLNELITDLLDLSRVENGKLKFDETLFEVDDLVHNAADMIRQTYPDYQILVSGQSGIQVRGDVGRLEQVLLNYLTNAVKYSPDAKDISIHKRLENGLLIVSVQDSGIGIPKASQAEVFRKFYRVEGTEHRFQGLGVGLYICSEIIRRHNGSCWLQSEPGKGSTFFFSIPAGKQQEPPEVQ